MSDFSEDVRQGTVPVDYATTQRIAALGFEYRAIRGSENCMLFPDKSSHGPNLLFRDMKHLEAFVWLKA